MSHLPPRQTLPLCSTKDARPLSPGCRRESLHRRFVSALERHRPEVLQQLEVQEAQRKEREQQQGRLGKIFREASAVQTNPAAPQVEAGEAVEGGKSTSTFAFGFSL